MKVLQELKVLKVSKVMIELQELKILQEFKVLTVLKVMIELQELKVLKVQDKGSFRRWCDSLFAPLLMAQCTVHNAQCCWHSGECCYWDSGQCTVLLAQCRMLLMAQCTMLAQWRVHSAGTVFCTVLAKANLSKVTAAGTVDSAQCCWHNAQCNVHSA